MAEVDKLLPLDLCADLFRDYPLGGNASRTIGLQPRAAHPGLAAITQYSKIGHAVLSAEATNISAKEELLTGCHTEERIGRYRPPSAS